MLTELIDLRRARSAAVALVAVQTLDPDGLGRVVRDDDVGDVLRIVEQKDATPDELEIDEINAGLYAFDAAWLRARIGDVAASPVSGEFYLPALVELAHADRRPVVSLDVLDDGTLAGINDRSQLAAAEFQMRVAINEAPHAGRRDDASTPAPPTWTSPSSWERTSRSSRTSPCAARRGSVTAR